MRIWRGCSPANHPGSSVLGELKICDTSSVKQVRNQTERVILPTPPLISFLNLTIAPAQVISAYFAGWRKNPAALFAVRGLDDMLLGRN